VAATNLNQGRVEYFHEGDIIHSVLASSAIPVLFEPVEIGGDLYVDGGVIDNFPVKPVREDCRRLVGISLNPVHPEEDISSLFKIAERTFHLSVSSNIHQKINMCDLVFEPAGLESFGLLDASKGLEMFELGYETARTQLQSNQL
jgi:NTE family protein